jgi:hypothetical protein
MGQYHFCKLATVVDREKVNARDIWNVDDIDLSTMQTMRKIVAPKGVKQIGSLTSGDREAHVTLFSAVSAIGNTVPLCSFSKCIVPRLLCKR